MGDISRLRLWAGDKTMQQENKITARPIHSKYFVRWILARQMAHGGASPTLRVFILLVFLSLFSQFTDSRSSIIGAISGYLSLWTVYQLCLS